MQWARGTHRWLHRTTRRGVVSFLIFYGLTGGDADLRAGEASLGIPERQCGPRAAHTGEAAHEPAGPQPGPPTSELASVSTAELCRAWRASSATLHRPLSAGDLEHTAQLRHACLEELERRDPIAFQRWLASHRAAEDPTRFFHHPARR